MQTVYSSLSLNTVCLIVCSSNKNREPNKIEIENEKIRLRLNFKYSLKLHLPIRTKSWSTGDQEPRNTC